MVLDLVEPYVQWGALAGEKVSSCGTGRDEMGCNAAKSLPHRVEHAPSTRKGRLVMVSVFVP